MLCPRLFSNRDIPVATVTISEEITEKVLIWHHYTSFKGIFQFGGRGNYNFWILQKKT